uniref:DNA polymerase delta subunit 4 n=1 Tax=Myxine glutinosa TaxID=7769 RepID=UPI00359026EC
MSWGRGEPDGGRLWTTTSTRWLTTYPSAIPCKQQNNPEEEEEEEGGGSVGLQWRHVWGGGGSDWLIFPINTVGTAAETMPRKRLITDTLPAVKSDLRGVRPKKAAGSSVRGCTRQAPESTSKTIPHVHGGVTESELQVLRTFDLNFEFGPCTGISRKQRWNRAVHLGLTPPQHIHSLLDFYPNDPQVQQCIWYNDFKFTGGR